MGEGGGDPGEREQTGLDHGGPVRALQAHCGARGLRPATETTGGEGGQRTGLGHRPGRVLRQPHGRPVQRPSPGREALAVQPAQHVVVEVRARVAEADGERGVLCEPAQGRGGGARLRGQLRGQLREELATGVAAGGVAADPPGELRTDHLRWRRRVQQGADPGASVHRPAQAHQPRLERARPFGGDQRVQRVADPGGVGAHRLVQRDDPQGEFGAQRDQGCPGHRRSARPGARPPGPSRPPPSVRPLSV